MRNLEPARSTLLVAAAVLLLGGSPAAPQDGPTYVPVSLIRDKGARDAVRRASEGAARRLEQPACTAVFSDFAAADGRPLSQKLAALGQTASRYFRGIVFADGRGLARCNERGVIALTVPGSRVVYVCPRQFARATFEDPAWGEAALIHETLHSLGLGENPPTARQIHERVLQRCAR